MLSTDKWPESVCYRKNITITKTTLACADFCISVILELAINPVLFWHELQICRHVELPIDSGGRSCKHGLILSDALRWSFCGWWFRPQLNTVMCFIWPFILETGNVWTSSRVHSWGSQLFNVCSQLKSWPYVPKSPLMLFAQWNIPLTHQPAHPELCCSPAARQVTSWCPFLCPPWVLQGCGALLAKHLRCNSSSPT